MANRANITADERARAVRESSEAVAAALLVGGANRNRYGTLKKELANDCLKGDDNYPTTIEDARNLINNYEPLYRPVPQPRFLHDEGVAMAQRGSDAGRGSGTGG